MFRAAMCHPSSGGLIVSIRHLVYVTLYRWPFGVQVWMSLTQTCTPDGHLYTGTYTRCRIDTINPPDDGWHMAVRNMWRIEINAYEKELCVKLVIYKDYYWVIRNALRSAIFQASAARHRSLLSSCNSVPTFRDNPSVPLPRVNKSTMKLLVIPKPRERYLYSLRVI